MDILLSALLIGLLGSFHCVGMCGPLALSLPLRGESAIQKLLGGLLWSLGRVTTYGIMGALFGLIGGGFHFLGFQQAISVAMGLLMIIWVLLPSMFKYIHIPGLKILSNPIRRGMQRLFQEKNNKALFLIGILNGLLPCGLVYFAIAGAIGTASFSMGILYMILFGLGTIPMLVMIAFLGNFVSSTVREKVNKVVPVVVFIIGILFVLRGLTLGIPYLSPPKEKLNPASHITMGMGNEMKATEGACCKEKK